MPDLTITPANITEGVITGQSLITAATLAGESITAGQSVYKLSSDGKLYRADANASSTAAAAVGVAMHAALTNQPLKYAQSGPLNFGAILTAGSWYVQSTTAGGIAAMSDLASGAYSTLIGYGYTTGTMVLAVSATGVSLA